MIRSVDPGRGSSIVMLAPESPRILRIRAPPLPMIAPANCSRAKNVTQHQLQCKRKTHVFRNGNLSCLLMAAILLAENPLIVVHSV